MIGMRNLLWSLFAPAVLALSNEAQVPADSSISTTATTASTYTLRHRIFDPSTGSTPWSVRGSVSVISDGASEWESSHGEVLNVKDVGMDAWYQVALGINGDVGDADEARYGMSSVRLCHLQTSPNLTLSVRLDETPAEVPKSIHLSLSSSRGVPKDGRCSGPLASDELPKMAFHVQLVRPEVLIPISPQLYASTSSPDTPALDPQTGKPQAPATKEKTFFQKYWIYAFAGMMIFAMMSGEEPQKKGPAK